MTRGIFFNPPLQTWLAGWCPRHLYAAESIFLAVTGKRGGEEPANKDLMGYFRQIYTPLHSLNDTKKVRATIFYHWTNLFLLVAHSLLQNWSYHRLSCHTLKHRSHRMDHMSWKPELFLLFNVGSHWSAQGQSLLHETQKLISLGMHFTFQRC